MAGGSFSGGFVHATTWVRLGESAVGVGGSRVMAILGCGVHRSFAELETDGAAC